MISKKFKSLVANLKHEDIPEYQNFILNSVSNLIDECWKEKRELEAVIHDIKREGPFLSSAITREMRDFYSRAWLDMDENELLMRMNAFIGILGAGLSSNLPERLIKAGFLRHFICDGDVVENQNRLRQNYKRSDIGKNKALALAETLKEEYPFSHIYPYPRYLADWSTKLLLKETRLKYVVNAIDFDSPAFVTSHKLTKEFCKLEFFPFLLGEKAVVIVNDKNSEDFTKFFQSKDHNQIKGKIINHCLNRMMLETPSKREEMLGKLKNYNAFDPFHPSDPQVNRSASKAMDLITELIILDLRDEMEERESSLLKFPEVYIV